MISIIIPYYNAKDTIKNTLYSIAMQTCKNIGVILVDDGSAEEDSEYVKDLINQMPFYIHYVKNNKNMGVSASRNIGLNIALMSSLTEEVMFVDADDTLLTKDTIEILYGAIHCKRKDVASGKIITYNKNGKEIIIPNTNKVWLHGKMFDAAFLRERNIQFLPKVRYNEDLYFIQKCYSYTENIELIDNILYCWNYRIGSITRTSNECAHEKMADDFCKIMCVLIKDFSERENPNTYTLETLPLNIAKLYKYSQVYSSVIQPNTKMLIQFVLNLKSVEEYFIKYPNAVQVYLSRAFENIPKLKNGVMPILERTPIEFMNLYSPKISKIIKNTIGELSK